MSIAIVTGSAGLISLDPSRYSAEQEMDFVCTTEAAVA